MEQNPSSDSKRDVQMKHSFEVTKDASAEKKESKSVKKKKSDPAVIKSTSDVKAEVPEQPKATNVRETLDALFTPKDVHESEQLHENADSEIITDEETIYITEQYLENRSNELRDELGNAEADGPAEIAVLANASLLDEIKTRIELGEIPDEQLLDQALADATEIFVPGGSKEAGSADYGAEVTEKSSVDADAVEVRETANHEIVHTVQGTPSETSSFSVASERIAKRPTASETVSIAPNSYRHPKARAADLLIGGTIGYLVGRRKGRLQTQAKLEPIQKGLERQVVELQQNIAIREQKIRQMAEAHTAESTLPVAPLITERLQKRSQERAQLIHHEVVQKPIPKVERIGQILIAKPETVSKPDSEIRSAQMLKNTQLIEVAKKIEVQGSSLSKMYEAGRIDIDGVRKVVAEYLLNGDYKRLLTENLRHNSSSPEFLHQNNTRNSDQGMAGGGALPVANNSSVNNSTSASKLPSTAGSAPHSQKSQKQKQQRQQASVAISIGLIFLLILVFMMLGL